MARAGVNEEGKRKEEGDVKYSVLYGKSRFSSNMSNETSSMRGTGHDRHLCHDSDSRVAA